MFILIIDTGAPVSLTPFSGLRSRENTVRKKTFEHYACDYDITINHIHGNNRVFDSKEFNKVFD